MTINKTLKIEASYKNLNAAAKFAGEWAQKAKLDARAAYAVQMAIDEACGNIIAHAYGGDSKGEILLAGRLIEQNLEISITDFGIDFSSADEGQMGQFLMRQLMDSVLFVAEDAQNTVTLRKNKGAIQ